MQDYDRQISDLTAYCEQKNYVIAKVIATKITGTKTLADRQDLQELLAAANNNEFQKVIVSEISRIGRNARDIRNTIDQLHKKRIAVVFKNLGGLESIDDRGEESFVMDNHYYVVPNIKPGKYYFFGFDQGSVYNFMTDGSTVKDSDLIEVKPGEIKYVGSLDYIKNDRSFFEKVKGTGTYSLSKATHPTELEMLQWLMQTAKGSGWEADIKKRMHELGK